MAIAYAFSCDIGGAMGFQKVHVYKEIINSHCKWINFEKEKMCQPMGKLWPKT